MHAVVDAEINRVKLCVRRVCKIDPVEAETHFIDEAGTDDVRFVQGQELSQAEASVAEARDSVALYIRLFTQGVLVDVVAVQPVVFAEVVTDIYRPLVNVRQGGSRSNEARCAGGIEEVSPWNQFDEFPDDGVCDGRTLGVAQDQAIQVYALSLAQNFVIKEKEGAILAAS